MSKRSRYRLRRARKSRIITIDDVLSGAGPDWANVVWQMNMEQATASTLTDQSSYGRTVGYSAGTLRTDLAKFGSNSIQKASGSSTAWFTTANASLNIGLNDFSIEAFVRFTGLADGTIFCQWSTTNDRSFIFGFDNTSKILYFYYSTDGTAAVTTLTGSWTPAIETWYHVAVCRSAGQTRLFVDGEQVGSTLDMSAATLATSTRNVHLMFGNGAENNWNGQLDEFRFVIGEGIYDSAFSPPTEAHPTS